MTPGLPGTGIGGLFYTLSALWMPASALWRWCRRGGAAAPRWALVARQFSIAFGIVAAMTATFWALDLAFIRHEAGEAGSDSRAKAISLRVSAVVLTSGVLVLVLGAMHALRLFLART
jgi:hypothetical protein